MYKLVYFNSRGLAEISRLLFAISKKEYEDVRYPLEVIDFEKHLYNRKEFDEDKSKGLFDYSMQKLPILELTDSVNFKYIINQSRAIERFLAREFNLYSSDSLEAAKIDAICDSVRDIRECFFKHEINDDSSLFNKLILLSNLLSDNIGYAVGDRLTLADVTIFHFMHEMGSVNAKYLSLFNKFIRISAIYDNVEPLVKDYIEKREKTNF